MTGDLARDLALALDPVALMMAAGMVPDPWQAAFLRAPAPRALLLCARQTGKSTVVGALATHTALYQPGSLVLLFAPGQRQAVELFRKVTLFFKAVAPVEPDAESALRMELPNRSRIVALPGSPDTVRGYSAPDLVVIDEAAFVADELYAAVRPMLATSRGRLVAMTTPAGCSGWFYKAWTTGGDAWSRSTIRAADCARIPASFLAAERAALPAHVYAAEYDVEFVDTAAQVFGSALIERAMVPTVRPSPLRLPW